MTKPICACCGKPYGARNTKSEQIFCPDDDTGKPPVAPPYRGNGKVSRESYWPDDDGWYAGHRSHEKVRETPPEPPTGNRFDQVAHMRRVMADHRPGRSLTRTVWIPGDYRMPYEPFCTLICALAFARGSYRNGYRIRKKEAA